MQSSRSKLMTHTIVAIIFRWLCAKAWTINGMVLIRWLPNFTAKRVANERQRMPCVDLHWLASFDKFNVQLKIVWTICFWKSSSTDLLTNQWQPMRTCCWRSPLNYKFTVFIVNYLLDEVWMTNVQRENISILCPVQKYASYIKVFSLEFWCIFNTILSDLDIWLEQSKKIQHEKNGFKFC